MRYAAKRTWPDRPKSWEHQGEGENLEAFALDFASDRGLGVGTEFVVLDKDSDDASLEFFRVTGTEPYALGPTGARPEGPAGAQGQPDSPFATGAAPDSAPPAAFVSSALSFVWFMGKVAILALVAVVAIGYVLRQLFPAD